MSYVQCPMSNVQSLRSKRRHEKGDTPAAMTMHSVMPDLISLPCEILFCFVFNRACPVLDTGASRDKTGTGIFFLGLLRKQPVPLSHFARSNVQHRTFNVEHRTRSIISTTHYLPQTTCCIACDYCSLLKISWVPIFLSKTTSSFLWKVIL